MTDSRNPRDSRTCDTPRRPSPQQDSGASGARQKYDVFSSKCPSRNLLNDVTRRWSILVLVALRERSGGAARFSQIRHRVDGISDRMLSYTLNLLVKDRLIATQSSAEGRGSLYALTDAGRTIADKSEEMFQSLYAALDQLVDEYDVQVDDAEVSDAA